MVAGSPPQTRLLLGRYRVYDEIAAGGMATVHLGRLVGDVGFSRTVAVKRLHPHFAKDRDLVAMFTDEARIAARIHHPNVVPTLDVIAQDGEVFLVMEYVHGEALSRLMVATSRRKEKIPPRIAAAIVSNALHGLHAAHIAKDADGSLLGVVHRDISPQNILVGVDGIARVLDFGVAAAAGRLYQTKEGAIKGKVAYMSPEQLRAQPVDRRSDVYAAGVVLWEALTCQRLYAGNAETLIASRLHETPIEPPSAHAPDVPAYLDAIVLKALRLAPEERFPTALAMAEAIEMQGPVASVSAIAAWVEALAAEPLAERARIITRIEHDEKQNDAAPKAPHRVEATVKIATANLLAAPAPSPLRDPPTMQNLVNTVPMRHDQKTPPSVTLPFSPRRSNAASGGVQKKKQRSPYFWWIWAAICLGVFLLSAGIVALIVSGPAQAPQTTTGKTSAP